MNDTVKYFHDEKVHDLRDPSQLVPILTDLFHPKTVCDVGCGVGNFLYTFKQHGVTTVLGFDGAWVDKNIVRKYLEESEFEIIDFESVKFPHAKRFDLTLCLEVGEHISHNNSENLVKYLCQLSDVIVFSAAIPYQGGLNHINEQWEEYWETRFKVHGFKRYDIIRHKIFDNSSIRWWYRQNMVVYSKMNLDHCLQFPYRNVIIKENYEYKTEILNRNARLMNGELAIGFYIKFFLRIVAIKILGRKRFEGLRSKSTI